MLASLLSAGASDIVGGAIGGGGKTATGAI
jgi:hypothetical protein